MANVFGVIITNATLEGMPEFAGRPITRKDRADVALRNQNAGNKATTTLNFLDGLRAQASAGVNTRCMIYNATGDTVRFQLSRDFRGWIGASPYPIDIGNGQWGAFLHVRAGLTGDSAAAVVYRGLNNAGAQCDWMLSWRNPYWRIANDNSVYTEIRGAGTFPSQWDRISGLLHSSGKYHQDTWTGCSSIVQTGTGRHPIFEGIMTLV